MVSEKAVTTGKGFVQLVVDNVEPEANQKLFPLSSDLCKEAGNGLSLKWGRVLLIDSVLQVILDN